MENALKERLLIEGRSGLNTKRSRTMQKSGIEFRLVDVYSHADDGIIEFISGKRTFQQNSAKFISAEK